MFKPEEGQKSSSTSQMLATMGAEQHQNLDESHLIESHTQPRGWEAYRPPVEPIPNLNATVPAHGPLKYDVRERMYYTGLSLDELAAKHAAEENPAIDTAKDTAQPSGSCNIL